jgi:hypothetical protein
MTYRVTFRKRFSGDAEEADRPEAFIHVLDGVVLNAVKAETIDPPALHSQDVLDEDDNFESIGSETWEYEIAEDRDREFVEALENSGMVLDYEPIDDVTA